MNAITFYDDGFVRVANVADTSGVQVIPETGVELDTEGNGTMVAPDA